MKWRLGKLPLLPQLETLPGAVRALTGHPLAAKPVR